MAVDDLITSGSPLSQSYTSKELEVKASDTTKKTLRDVQKALKDINKVITTINTNLKESPTHLNKITAEMDKLREMDSKSLRAFSKGSYSSQINRAALQHYSADLLYNNPAYIQSQAYAAGNKITKANRANYLSGLTTQIIGSSLGTRTGTLNQKIFTGLNESTLKDYKKALNDAEDGLRSMFYAGEIGAQKFNKAMKNLSGASEKYILPIETSLKNTAKETSKNAREMERWERISDGSLALIQTRLLANYTIINTVSGAFQYLLGYVVDLDKELRNLQAITGVSNNGLKSLKTSIVDTANATRYTSLEVAQAATILGQAGLSVNQIKETLKPIAELATASGTELTTATEVITSTLNIYELQMSEAARVTNALTTAVNESKADIGGMQYALQYAGKSAADLGMSFEETAAAVAAMTQAGIKSRSTLGTGLRAILVELLNPTAKLQRQIESVGLTLDDVDVKSLGFTQVLKNLRDAGFGVAEAYAGMERRGASAMTALLSQVDFIDELRENMNGSSAAIKGNLSQMQAFANVIDNTRSIVGSAASDALEPYLRVLTSIFKVINEGIGSMDEFTKSLVFGGTILAGLSITAKAFYGILANIFKLLGKGSMLTTLLGGTGIKGVVALTAAVAALGYAIDKLIDYFYKYENRLDELQSKMEDASGEVSKYQESYNSLSNMMDRALQNQERLFDSSGRPTHELDLFMNEMISRFPQVNDILSKNINSFEDLVAVISEARLEMTKLAAQADDSMTELGNSANKVAAKLMGRNLLGGVVDENQYSGGKYRLGSSILLDKSKEYLDMISSAGIINSKNQSNILSRIERAYSSGGFFSQQKESSAEREFGVAIKDALDERFSQGYQEQTQLLRQISAFLANPRVPSEMKEFFNQYADYIKANQQDLKGELSSAVADVVNRNIINLTGFSDRIKGVAAQYKELETGNVSLESVTDYVNKTEVIKKAAQDIEEDLKNLPDEIFGSEDWSDYIKKGIKPEAIRYEIANSLGGYYQSLISENRKLIADMTKDNEELVKKSKRDMQKTDEGRLNTLLRGLSSTKSSKLDSDLAEITELYNRQRDLALTAAEQEFGKLPGGAATLKIRTDSINAEFDEKIKSAKDSVRDMKDSIDSLTSKTESYFKSIQTANEAVASEYDRALTKLESQFKYREGLLEGLGDIGQGNTQLSEYINNTLSYDRREGLLVQYDYAQRNLKYYQNQLKNVLGNTDYQKVIQTRKDAESRLNAARANVGNYSKTEIDTLNRQYESAVRSEQRYIDVINELQDKIVELKDSINSLKGNMDAVDKLSNLSLGEASLFGAKAGAYNYLRSNNSAAPNMGRSMFELTALTTNTGLSEMENQFANLFQTIQDGSFTAKSAFQNFTSGVLQAMADVVYSEVAKSMMKYLVGLFQVSQINPMGDTPSLGANVASSAISSAATGGTPTPGIWDTITSFFGFAQGGLVTGPIKNRDSVLTKLTPGEFVMTKQATDALGTDFLNNLNNGNAQVLGNINNSNGLNGGISPSGKSKESIVNVWVVTPDQMPASEGPTDVVARVAQDIRTNGPIKKLIKQVSTGAI